MRFIIALLFVLLFPTVVLSQGAKMKFSFKKNLVLGEQNHSEYFLAAPNMVIANSKGEIFVADDRQGTILVFDKSGNFLRSFGRKGRGPGEFSKINSMTLLPEGRILIYDFFQRRFTIFDSSGKFISSHSTPNKTYMKPEKIRFIEGKGFVLFYRTLLGQRGEVKENEDYLVHILSEDFSSLTTHLTPISETIDITDNFEVEFEGGSLQGHFTVNDSTITVAPYFYRGKILQYTKANNWKLSKVFNGYVQTEKTYQPVDNPRDIIGIGYGTRSNRFGALAGIMKNESLGIFQQSNGDYLYLGLLEIDGEQQLYVNLFNERGELKAHGPVTNLHPGIQKNGFYRRMRFYWMDEQDQLYVIDGAEDGFNVYRGTIELKE